MMAMQHDGGGGGSVFGARTQREIQVTIASADRPVIATHENTWADVAKRATELRTEVQRRLNSLLDEDGWTGPGADAFRRVITSDLLDVLATQAAAARALAGKVGTLNQSLTQTTAVAEHNDVPWDQDVQWQVVWHRPDQTFFGWLDEVFTGDDDDLERRTAEQPYELLNGQQALLKQIPKQQWETMLQQTPISNATPVYQATQFPVSAQTHRFDRLMEQLGMNATPRGAVSAAASATNTALGGYAPPEVEYATFADGSTALQRTQGTIPGTSSYRPNAVPPYYQQSASPIPSTGSGLPSSNGSPYAPTPASPPEAGTPRPGNAMSPTPGFDSSGHQSGPTLDSRPGSQNSGPGLGPSALDPGPAYGPGTSGAGVPGGAQLPGTPGGIAAGPASGPAPVPSTFSNQPSAGTTMPASLPGSSAPGMMPPMLGAGPGSAGAKRGTSGRSPLLPDDLLKDPATISNRVTARSGPGGVPTGPLGPTAPTNTAGTAGLRGGGGTFLMGPGGRPMVSPGNVGGLAGPGGSPAGGGAGGGMAPMMPMTGRGNGKKSESKNQYQSWLEEDTDVWTDQPRPARDR